MGKSDVSERCPAIKPKRCNELAVGEGELNCRVVDMTRAKAAYWLMERRASSTLAAAILPLWPSADLLQLEAVCAL